MVYTVITKHQVSNCCDNPEKIVAEQEEKRKVFGLVDDDQYLCHFFESKFSNGRTAYYTIDDAIQFQALKSGLLINNLHVNGTIAMMNSLKLL